MIILEKEMSEEKEKQKAIQAVKNAYGIVCRKMMRQWPEIDFFELVNDINQLNIDLYGHKMYSSVIEKSYKIINKANNLIIAYTEEMFVINKTILNGQKNNIENVLLECKTALLDGMNYERKKISDKCHFVVEKIESTIKTHNKAQEELKNRRKNRKIRIDELKTNLLQINKEKRFYFEAVIEFAEQVFNTRPNSDEAEIAIEAAEQFWQKTKQIFCN